MTIHFIDKEDVLEIHFQTVNASGESQGLRDEGLLESALAKPENLYAYEGASLFEMAAS